LLLVLNNVIPVFQAGIWYYFRTIYNKEGKYPSEWMSIGYSIILMGVACLQLISGGILVKNVFAIKKYFTERKAENFINTAMLLRHASCFGVYMLTTFVYFTSFCIYAWFPKPSIYVYVDALGIFYNLGGIVS
jgi:hypothetical protein